MSSTTILPFDPDGYLIRDVRLTLGELESSQLVTGAGLAIRVWQGDRRLRFVQNLRHVVSELRWAGFRGEIGIDGSFVSVTAVCRDIDVYLVVGPDEFDVFDQRLDALNERAGERIWDFSEEGQVTVRAADGPISPLRARYDVDLRIDMGMFCGIFGPHGERLSFRQAFHQRTHSKGFKGVVILDG